MSADDDTFEIDIYGDDQPEPEPVKDEPQNGAINGLDGAGDDVKPESTANGNAAQQNVKQGPSASVTPAQQGVKRKASAEDQEYQEGYGDEEGYGDYIDNRPVDPGAMPAIKLADLHWWTTEEDVRGFCAKACAEEELHDLSFGEHKINGKSKGEAYLEFASPQAATAVKREIDAASQIKEESGVRKTPFTAYFTPVGNPFKTAAGASGKKDFSQNNGSRGGAYNNFPARGGSGFAGRGNFNNNRGGGGFNSNNNMMQNRPNQQAGGWGMNGAMGANAGMGGFGGGFNNPMMAAGFGNMNMGYGNMARGGMMNNMGMMGRGGFGGMGMGNMNMGGIMGGRGGGAGMMGGRGGWAGGNGGGGGFQQGYGGGGGFAAGGSMSPQGGQGGNKRAKME